MKRAAAAIALAFFLTLSACSLQDQGPQGGQPSPGILADAEPTPDSEPGAPATSPAPITGGSAGAPTPSSLPDTGEPPNEKIPGDSADSAWLDEGLGMLRGNSGAKLFVYAPVQTVPDDVELRDGAFVVRPYGTGAFVNDSDYYNEPGLDENAPRNVYGFLERYGAPCSVWCGAVDHYTAEASSVLPAAAGRSYAPENLMSGLRDSVWCEGADGYGIGEYVEIDYTLGRADHFIYETLYHEGEPEQRPGYIPEPFEFTSLCIVNGYAASERLWSANSRVKTLKMYVDGELHSYLELEDIMEPQYFPLYELVGLETLSTVFRFEIDAVYPGDKYDDTCLTGIEFGFTGIEVH